jgi:Zn-dependent protease
MFDIQSIILSAPAILFALTIHEFSHGYVAWRLGDPTAKMMGRLTLNPLKHLDPIGTIALFLFGFGWAKPVPIDPRNFQHPTRDMAISSLAGPAANLLTAAVSGLVLRAFYLFPVGEFALRITWPFLVFNLVLCFFNLLPIPPLDGSRLLYHLLPPNLAAGFARLERYGFIILIGIMLVSDLAGIPLLQLYITPLIRVFSLLFVGRPMS